MFLNNAIQAWSLADLIFMLNFHEFLHTMYKCVLNAVAKISMMFAQYVQYYAIILREDVFCGHAVVTAVGRFGVMKSQRCGFTRTVLGGL